MANNLVCARIDIQLPKHLLIDFSSLNLQELFQFLINRQGPHRPGADPADV